ncbi:MAG TPA: hypothetical protein VGF39_11675 [Stellaceae bacterium]|jgi:hypothetical protein
MGSLASAASVGSSGLKAYGDIVSAQGTAAGQRYRAETLQQTAQRTRVAAVQTGAAESEQLASTLGNIRAARAAARGDPTSPMAAAYSDMQEDLGLTKKSIDVDNLVAKANQDDSDALYLQSTAKYALLSGDIAAGSDMLKAISGALTPPTGGTGLPTGG